MENLNWPFLTFFNLTGASPSAMCAQMHEYAVWVREQVTSEDVYPTLDAAHRRFALRVWALDSVARYVTSEDDREAWAMEICEALAFMTSGKLEYRDRLRDMHQRLDAQNLGRLTVVRLVAPATLLASDRVGWVTAAASGFAVAHINPDALGSLADDVTSAVGLLRKATAGPSTTELTASQREAVKSLTHHWSMVDNAQVVAGIAVRATPLIVAASGTGKTFVVRHFAEISKLPLLHLDVTSWVPNGATNRPYSLEVVGQWLRSHDSGIIALDELDKVEGGLAGSSSWNRHVRGELFAMIDRRVIGVAGWTPELNEKLRNFLFIGLGTWQHLHRRKPVAGFGSRPAEAIDVMRENDSIPEELAFRFSSPAIYLTTPESTEFALRIAKIHRALGTPAPSDIAKLAREAHESGLGMRWLESYVSEVIRRRIYSVGARIAARLRAVEKAKADSTLEQNDA